MKRKRTKYKLNSFIFIWFVISAIIWGCESKDYSIHIRYFNWGTTSATPISCEEIVKAIHFINDTVINDKAFYNEFIDEIGMLEKADPNEYGNDFRIRCEFKNRDGQPMVLCSGESYDVVLNGEQMKDSDRLFVLLKKLLYSQDVNYDKQTFE
jgi:hypothetical protein